MKEDRRIRLEAVIEPLIELQDFSASEAKTCCSETPSGYVTRTVHQLADDGLLCKVSCHDGIRYRWSRSARAGSCLRLWIDRQIHGLQIKQSPPEDRPRERLLRQGPSELTNADLLSILIHVGIVGESAVASGQRIANRFASKLTDLPDCSMQELKQISPAATKHSYAKIMAGIELGRRVARVERIPKRRRERINSTRAAIAYCRDRFARLAFNASQEEFHLVTLDTKHKPINNHQITIGTLDASLVHPREVFRAAIRDSASAVILVHNHPSGDPTPSREDMMVTDQITEGGKILGIAVLDHIIVASQDCVSIRECGYASTALQNDSGIRHAHGQESSVRSE